MDKLFFCIVSNTPSKGHTKIGYLQHWKNSPPPNQKEHRLNASARPPILGAVPPRFNIAGGKRRALVGLAAVDGVPDAGEGDAGDEDDGGVVHGVDGDGDGGRHAEEGDGEADPGWKIQC
jgi:hypothetical protein